MKRQMSRLSSDNEWQRVTTNDEEWQQMTVEDKFLKTQK